MEDVIFYRHCAIRVIRKSGEVTVAGAKSDWRFHWRGTASRGLRVYIRGCLFALIGF